MTASSPDSSTTTITGRTWRTIADSSSSSNDTEQDGWQRQLAIRRLLMPAIGNDKQAVRFFDLLANSNHAAFFTSATGNNQASLPPKRVFHSLVIAATDLFACRYLPSLAMIVQHFIRIAATNSNPSRDQFHVYMCTDRPQTAHHMFVQWDKLMNTVFGSTNNPASRDCILSVYAYASDSRRWNRIIRRHRYLLNVSQSDAIAQRSTEICDYFSMAVHLASQLPEQDVLLVGDSVQLLYSAIALAGQELLTTFNSPKRHLHCCIGGEGAAIACDKLANSLPAPYLYCDVNLLSLQMRNRLYPCAYGGNDRDALFLLCLLTTATGLSNASYYEYKHDNGCRRFATSRRVPPQMANARTPRPHRIRGLDGICTSCQLGERLPLYVSTKYWPSGRRIPQLQYQNMNELLGLRVERFSVSGLLVYRRRLCRLQWMLYFFMNSYLNAHITAPLDLIM